MPMYTCLFSLQIKIAANSKQNGFIGYNQLLQINVHANANKVTNTYWGRPRTFGYLHKGRNSTK
jgi:hypothetical protein